MGCDASKRQGASGSAWSTGAAGVERERTERKALAANDVSEQNSERGHRPVDNAPATRADLDEYLAKFRADKNWTYGERQPGQLAGTWVEVQSGANECVFDVDGVSGKFAIRFGENMAAGLYAVSENNRVVCFSKWNGIGVGSHFTLRGNTLSGPLGPNPTAKWKRTVPAP
jgi:hypothetical protein